ncbi:MAG: glucose dehydrogenase [Planctomycetota bacterium]|nr:MAG: glucose dehydrogenase [Planctomycetota bacterium]
MQLLPYVPECPQSPGIVGRSVLPVLAPCSGLCGRIALAISGAVLAVLVADRAVGQDVPEPNPPKIESASDEAALAMQGFRLAEGLQVDLFAAEPDIANPVAFWVADSGDVYVCETFRQGTGVVDNRSYDDAWVDRDLAAQTVEDRRRYHLELLDPDAIAQFYRFDDRIRLLIDRDRDGRADEAHVFADHFNDLIDGTGAGVLEFKGNVYYTCIPNLYLMRDEDGDHRADGKTILHTGFGVRVAFRGHDLHGLTIGPDGRLYFSIGDRGANIPVPGGRIVNVESGSVFRCELDGSNLELYATGLRNPQELAFDDWGNLFTGDNNSDSGDRARWVYVLEGGDSGWRMAYQYLPDRGPFNRQRLWEPWHAGQPAYIVPPVANIADGPSGLDYYPGTGFGDRFREQFLLADFRGSANQSGIRSIRNEPDGAFFRIAEDGQPVWEILATDVQFGPDGGLYISDWVDGWVGVGKGRLYRVVDPRAEDPRVIAEVRDWLAANVAEMPAEDLAAALSHADRRIRLKAQLELAARGRADMLQRAARHGVHRLARLHALWGLEHCTRLHPEHRASLSQLLQELAASDDAQLRAHAIRLIGETGDADSLDLVRAGLVDSSPRVVYFAMMSVGKLRDAASFESIVDRIAQHPASDPALRHAGIMALASIATADRLRELADHPSTQVRLAAVVALRRQLSPAVATYLDDPDPAVFVEAACAIHDQPIPEALEALAASIDRRRAPEPFWRRVLNANFRLGGQRGAEALGEFAADSSRSRAMRIEAMQMLGDWADPRDRDRVLGMWRPIGPRSPAPAIAALRKRMESIAQEADQELLLELGRAASRLAMREAIPVLERISRNEEIDASARAEAIRALVDLEAPGASDIVRRAWQAPQQELRIVALELTPQTMPEEAESVLSQAALTAATMEERQAAIEGLSRLNGLSGPGLNVLEAWAAGDLPPEVALECRLLAEKFASLPPVRSLLDRVMSQRSPDSKLDAYREALYGGNAKAGREIFFNKVSVSCVRCHKVDGTGGDVGPDLSKIGLEKSREYLLEAIVDPNKEIAKGFASAVVLDADGLVHTGVVREETDEVLKLVDAEGNEIVIPQDDIESRRPSNSAMPEDTVKNLTLKELRDLVEFLSRLKGQPGKAQAEVL